MNVSELNLVPLQHASLCMDCEMITAAHTHCCACGSAALLNLAKTLNGAEDFTPMPRAFAVVGSVERSFAPLRASCISSRRPRSFGGGKCLPFPSAEVAADAGNVRRMLSFREFAAAVQRAMTIAIIGILILGGPVTARLMLQSQEVRGLRSTAVCGDSSEGTAIVSDAFSCGK
jgi:hypothetical protein